MSSSMAMIWSIRLIEQEYEVPIMDRSKILSCGNGWKHLKGDWACLKSGTCKGDIGVIMDSSNRDRVPICLIPWISWNLSCEFGKQNCCRPSQVLFPLDIFWCRLKRQALNNNYIISNHPHFGHKGIWIQWGAKGFSCFASSEYHVHNLGNTSSKLTRKYVTEWWLSQLSNHI